MTVDIAAEITGVWPTTEKTLLEDGTAGYAAQKLRAIARAKRDLYGALTVPADADLPDSAAYWIADKAVAGYLIPLARDYYMSKQRLSDSKDGMSIGYYDKLRALDSLRAELDAKCLADYETVYAGLTSVVEPASTPALSTAGMIVDPARRAYARGYPGGVW
jgi:hypothetical protein